MQSKCLYLGAKVKLINFKDKIMKKILIGLFIMLNILNAYAITNENKAYDTKEMNEYNFLGSKYYFGDGVKQDKQKAKQLYTKACDGGDANGCYNLGVMSDNGDGATQDKQKAKELYTKSCDAGNMGGCVNLGLMYTTGDGIRQDKQKAKKLFAKACDGGNMGGCKGYKILDSQQSPSNNNATASIKIYKSIY
jgi:TPR repeat protein